jgi:peptidase E
MTNPRATRGARPSPVYLLAGSPGARKNVYRPLVGEILQGVGIPRPTVAYLGAATDDDPRFLGFMEGLVTSSGPCQFRLAPVKGRKAQGGAARRIIEDADLVFLGGGDVELGMERLREHDLAQVLAKKQASGAPLFGISAGAILLCKQWIRWSDPDDDGSAELFDCLGLAPVLCDCHGEEDGWSELRALLRLVGRRSLGHGIRAGAAVRVEADGSVATVCGEVDRLQR